MITHIAENCHIVAREGQALIDVGLARGYDPFAGERLTVLAAMVAAAQEAETIVALLNLDSETKRLHNTNSEAKPANEVVLETARAALTAVRGRLNTLRLIADTAPLAERNAIARAEAALIVRWNTGPTPRVAGVANEVQALLRRAEAVELDASQYLTQRAAYEVSTVTCAELKNRTNGNRRANTDH